MKIELNKTFRPNSKVDEFDTRQIKKALNRLGYYTPYEKTGITGMADRAVFDALKKFQHDHGLTATGTAQPDDETITSLNAQISKEPEGIYIWRSVEDSKVRSSHAAYNRTERAWSDSPDPQEEPNCRCWVDLSKNKKKCFDHLPWEDEAMANIKEHENDFVWPYLDTKGIITIGIGINIDKKSIFTSLPWKVADKHNGKMATPKEIEQSYENLKNFAQVNKSSAGQINTLARAFRDITSLRLDDTARNLLFIERYNTLKEELQRKNFKFDVFKCFPPQAKIALMDMHFNMGMSNFNEKKWPSLFLAANTRDWTTAATESHRRDVNSQRNSTTNAQFLQATEMEKSNDQKQQ